MLADALKQNAKTGSPLIPAHSSIWGSYVECIDLMEKNRLVRPGGKA